MVWRPLLNVFMLHTSLGEMPIIVILKAPGASPADLFSWWEEIKWRRITLTLALSR